MTYSYLFVLPWSLLTPGGVNHVVLNLCKEMTDAGKIQPIVLVLDWSATRPQWGQFEGVRTVRWRIRSYRSDMGPRETIRYLWWEWLFAAPFKRFCRLHKIAAINAHYVGETSLTFDRLIKRTKLKIPLILSFHGSDLRTIANQPAARKKEWRSLCTRNIVVACSMGLARRIATTLGEDITPLTIHNGISPSRLIASDVAELLPAGRFILHVGSFDANKGQDLLIEAFASIQDVYGDLHLVLVGAVSPDDEKLKELKRLVWNRGLDTRIHFFPDMPHDRVAGFFANALLFALPSREEAFGIVILEAGVFAVPVVASNVGGVPEIICNGVTGRLVKSDDSRELARVLRSMLDNPIEAQAMGKRLQQHVLARFTWRAAYDSYVALVEKAGSRRH